MGYKSTRLLVEAVNTGMDELRKQLMGMSLDAVVRDAQFGDALGTLNEMRELIDELIEKADRQTLDEVRELPALQYVTTMKPLVANFHRQLMGANHLAPVLCEDLKANAIVLIVLTDEKTLIRTSHDQTKPAAALAVETLLAVIDDGTKKVIEEATVEAEKAQALDEEAVEEWPKRIRYADPIQGSDFRRNCKAEFVVDCEGVVIKDRFGEQGRKATQEEIDGCIVVQDPGSGVGIEEDQ